MQKNITMKKTLKIWSQIMTFFLKEITAESTTYQATQT